MRHNHKDHGVVAMARLGATQDRVQRYLNELNKVYPVYNADEPLTELLEIDFLKVKKTILLQYSGFLHLQRIFPATYLLKKHMSHMLLPHF